MEKYMDVKIIFLFEIHLIHYLYIFNYLLMGNSHGVMTKVLDCNLEVSEF